MISLRRLASVGLLLREIRSLRKAAERIAAALELQNAHAIQGPRPILGVIHG